MSNIKSILFSSITAGSVVINSNGSFSINPYTQGENRKIFLEKIEAMRTHHIQNQKFPQIDSVQTKTLQTNSTEEYATIYFSYIARQYCKLLQSIANSKGNFSTNEFLTYAEKIFHENEPQIKEPNNPDTELMNKIKHVNWLKNNYKQDYGHNKIRSSDQLTTLCFTIFSLKSTIYSSDFSIPIFLKKNREHIPNEYSKGLWLDFIEILSKTDLAHKENFHPLIKEYINNLLVF